MKAKLPLGAIMLDVEGLVLNVADINRLQNPSVGGVILFGRNFESRAQIIELVRAIRQLREPELLIAVDQEGGRVQRFQEGFTRLPPMAVFGRLLDAAEHDQTAVISLVRDTAQLMAEELVACGIDFSFAPVLDLGMHIDTIIGDRAFHAAPEKLVQIARAFIQGMNLAGMQATGKHFPGHGHVLADSHLETPVDDRSLAEIKATDLHPYVALKDQLGAVMTAHINFNCVDDTLPTFSSFWLKKLLRQEIGFTGLIFSDDLIMQGACIEGNIVQRANSALRAGCDMILVCNDHAEMDTLLQAASFKPSSASQQRLISMKATSTSAMSAALLEQTKARLNALI